MKAINLVKIGNKLVGEGNPVFIIAEAGVNHNGDMKLARKMVDIAAGAGADAVKFQSYITENIITKKAPSAAYHKLAAGNKESWYDLLKRLELSLKEQEGLFSYCLKKGIIFLSTAYDRESAGFLQGLGISAFKIASTDANNLVLLEYVARFGKPILLSTGMADLREISESVGAIRKEGNRKIILLQCTANYPPRAVDVNLNVMEAFRKRFGVIVGYSDHLATYQSAIASVARGAKVYEVHYTLSRQMQGPDHKSSVEPRELKVIIQDIRLTQKLLGSFKKEITPSEKETRLKLRKSLVALSDIGQGEVFTEDNLGIKRPGRGLAAKYYRYFLGKSAKKNILKDKLLELCDIA